MDAETIRQISIAFGAVTSAIKQVIDLLPNGKKKDEIEQALKNAERQLKIAEAQSAQAMHYKLCQNHFPPEIMLTADGKNWKCPACGNEIKYVHSENPMNKYFGNR